jgi:hypothetical protein
MDNMSNEANYQRKKNSYFWLLYYLLLVQFPVQFPVQLPVQYFFAQPFLMMKKGLINEIKERSKTGKLGNWETGKLVKLTRQKKSTDYTL